MNRTLPFSSTAARAARAPVRPAASRAIAYWLLFCCLFLSLLIVVGGVTRLTHSGLSITEWQPIVGTIPPLNDAQWQEAFDKYRQTPEYQKVNQGMSLDEFQGIFWWEYVHRLLARSLGAVFLLPLLWFLWRGRVDRSLRWPLLGLFALGAAQGAMGWYMVKSGLVDNPRVSHLRLTAHLGLAFGIFTAMLWIALGQLRGGVGIATGAASGPRGTKAAGDATTRTLLRASTARTPVVNFAAAIAVLVFLQVLSGGMVAGIRAGFAYNTFPLMAGGVVPIGILMLDPWPLNFVYNVATIQFVHRTIAWALLVAVALYAWRTRDAAEVGAPVGRSARLLLAAMLLQFALGVATLVLVVPLPLAALHQAGAILLLAAALNAAHAARHAPG